jgi:hypothetical protein
MSSKKQPRSLHGNKTEPKYGLSRHYREIGIKAVAAATRKESPALPRTRNRNNAEGERNNTEGKRNNTEGGHYDNE